MARRGLRSVAASGLAVTTAAVAAAAAAVRELHHPVMADLRYSFTPFEAMAEAEDVRYAGPADIPLAAWWFDRPESKRVVVVSHGYGGSKADMLGIGPMLWRRGNTVMVHDFRGSGDSGKGPQSLGHFEQHDLRAAVDYAAARRPDAEVCLLGFSMGAAVSLMVAGTDPRVAKVVLDSPFADMRGVMANAARTRRLPVPLVGLADQLTGRLHGYRFDQVRPIDVADRVAPRPLLVIACTDDEVIPVEHSRRIAAAAGHAELVIVPGGYHCGAYFMDRPGYVERVAAFLER